MHRRDFARALGALALTPIVPLAPGAWPRGAQPAAARADGARLNGWLAELSRFGRNPQGG
jgi:hypothetical protein